MAEPSSRALYERIYATVDSIPPGRVATYGQIAREAGAPRHARAVGRALRNLPRGSTLPWHRVLNARGRISPRPGESQGLQQKRLQAEGVPIDPSGTVDLGRFRWQPDEQTPPPPPRIQDMRLRHALSLSLALLGAFSGCSMLTPQRIELPYPPHELARIAVSETSFTRPTSLVVHRFDDYRRQPRVVGEKRNALGMHVGEVESLTPVAEWLRNALSLELEDNHFHVVPSEEAGESALALHGELDLCTSRRQGRTEALVQFTVKLKRGYRILFTRTYRGGSTLTREELEALAGESGERADPFGEALARALARALLPLPEDLRSALAREAGERP